MSSEDFLHINAETNLCEHFSAGGVSCRLSTNCGALLEIAGHSFRKMQIPPDVADFTLRFWVDDRENAQPPWPQPYVRGLGHIVFAGFAAGSSLLADVRTRHVIGKFGAGMVGDAPYWKNIIFPMLLSVLAGSLGLLELHAACIARDDRGLVLIGPSRSGKSTLAMAFTEAGFRLLSDDRTFCSLKNGRLSAWGMPRPLKLRSEAALWFDEFRDREPVDTQNGEAVFHFDPNLRSGPNLGACRPRLVVFLERSTNLGFEMTRMPVDQLRSKIDQDLMAEAPEAAQKQKRTMDEMLTLPCWRLQYGGRPQAIASQLALHL